jgi:hypothetical protein
MTAFSWALGSARRERLLAALSAFEQEKFIQSTDPEPYRQLVEDAMKSAQRSLTDGRLHAGWGSLASARRLELLTLSGEALRVRAVALSLEASRKLGGWRKEAAAALLPAADELKETIRTAFHAETALSSSSLDEEKAARLSGEDEALRAAAWVVAYLIDGAADNGYFKQAVASEAVLMLVRLLAILAIVAVLTLTPTELFPPLPASSTSLRLLPFVAIFGAMGACLSGLRSLLGPSKGGVPETLLSSFSTAIRPLIGAVSAVVVFFAEAGGVLNVAKESVASILTLSFIAGFSEALVVRVLGDSDKSKS